MNCYLLLIGSVFRRKVHGLVHRALSTRTCEWNTGCACVHLENRGCSRSVPRVKSGRFNAHLETGGSESISQWPFTRHTGHLVRWTLRREAGSNGSAVFGLIADFRVLTLRFRGIFTIWSQGQEQETDELIFPLRTCGFELEFCCILQLGLKFKHFQEW